MKKACITGIGMIDALGNNPKDCFSGLIDNKDYHQKIESICSDYGNQLGLFPTSNIVLPDKVNRRHLVRALEYGIHSVDQAILDSGVCLSENVGVFYSSLTNGNDHKKDFINQEKFKHIRRSTNGLLDSIASYISIHYGFKGVNTCFQSACATGLVTIDFAINYIDEYDYIIVGGADAGCNNIDMKLFNMLHAIGSRSRPFDEKRNGFIMGEGGGCLVLESEEKAKARNAKIYGYVYPAGHASDAFGQTSPDGTGAFLSMKKAIENSGLWPDVINAHGTGTPIGDEVEYNSIREILDRPVYSIKGKIGHTFAGAGILEVIYSLLSMSNHIIPQTFGCVNSKMNVVKQNINKSTNVTLKNSFGFGGKCCSMIIEGNND